MLIAIRLIYRKPPAAAEVLAPTAYWPMVRITGVVSLCLKGYRNSQSYLNNCFPIHFQGLLGPFPFTVKSQLKVMHSSQERQLSTYQIRILTGSGRPPSIYGHLD